jgi:hypothetical protein
MAGKENMSRIQKGKGRFYGTVINVIISRLFLVPFLIRIILEISYKLFRLIGQKYTFLAQKANNFFKQKFQNKRTKIIRANPTPISSRLALLPAVLLDHVGQLDDILALLVLLAGLKGMLVLPAERGLAAVAVDIRHRVQPRQQHALLRGAAAHVYHRVEEVGPALAALQNSSQLHRVVRPAGGYLMETAASCS